MSPRTPARRLVLVLLACLGAVSPARAQVYARFAVPDSARVAAVRGSGGGYERAWNALLVSEIRATLARADSAARLGALARDVGELEAGLVLERPEALDREPAVGRARERQDRFTDVNVSS